MLWCVCHESPDFPNVFVYWQVFDSSGSFLSFVNTAADPLYGPQGLAVTSDGYVAVADSGNHCFKIYKYLQWNPTEVLGQSTLSKLHSSIVSHGESLCNTATVFVMQPSRKYNLQCLYDLYCIRSSSLPTIIYLRNNMEMLMGFCLSTSMNEYPDVTHLSCINCCIQGHSVHKQNPIYWDNCLHNQVQCPSL